jgi:hypothetical protein
LAFSEDNIRHRREIRDFTEEYIEEARNINIKKRIKLLLQRAIKVFPILGDIDEAARVKKN